ncbi:MAG: hypothetical protein J6P16_04680, partial [Eubacterium sp.]|nr:hypothetical protein [Eubacterium sp.]
MRYAVFFITALISLSLISGCSGKKQTPTAAPNAEVTYDEGADLTGVLKEVYADGEMVSFFNPVTETEETFLYSSATSIQSPGGMELTMDQVSPGEVFDLYLDDTGHKLDMMAMKSDIIEAEETRLSVDPDAHIMTVDGVNYRYSDACVVLSDDKQIDPMEITSMDEVTFRGTKGLVYSVIVTRGHGYLQPMEYTDFVGGTVTIEGESILPVTEGMLITVPE